jgi:hypothetical protein
MTWQYVACWIIKTTCTQACTCPGARAHAEILLAFPWQQWFINAPQCYVICTLSVLFKFMILLVIRHVILSLASRKWDMDASNYLLTCLYELGLTYRVHCSYHTTALGSVMLASNSYVTWFQNFSPFVLEDWVHNILCWKCDPLLVWTQWNCIVPIGSSRWWWPLLPSKAVNKQQNCCQLDCSAYAS